jgi:hypothetical protein
MNCQSSSASTPTASDSVGGGVDQNIVQDANGNIANLGARPKIRRNILNNLGGGGGGGGVADQVVPNENHAEENDLKNDILENEEAAEADSSEAGATNSDEDFYIYRYTGRSNGGLSNGGQYDDDLDPLEADLPKSFYHLDVGSDSDAAGTSLPRSGVSGAGQSNLSSEVAALIIQSEMASHSRRWRQQPPQQPQPQNGRESPDMDFLEMDFDPGESDSADERSDIIPLKRPQELKLEAEVNQAAAHVAIEAVEDGEQDDEVCFDLFVYNVSGPDNPRLPSRNGASLV